MASIRILRLEFSNFRSYKKKSVVEFSPTGLVLLEGNNLDTGGSSGSGKSTIPLAINFALGWCDIPSTELLSWGSDTPAKVALTLDCDGKEVIVGRGKSFTLKIDGVEYEGSNKQKEEKLRLLLGLPPEMMQALTYRGQRKPGLFLDKTDSAKKEFLTLLLGLDQFEAAVELGGKKVIDLEGDLKIQVAERDSIAYSIKELCHPDTPEGLQESIVLLDKVITKNLAAYQLAADAVTMKRFEVSTFRTDSDKAAKYAFDSYADDIAAAAKLANAPIPEFASTSSPELAKLNQTEEQVRTRLNRLGKEDDERQGALDKQRTDLNRTIQALNLKVGAIAGLKKEKVRLEAEMGKLLESICPTCEREWDQVADKRIQTQTALDGVEFQLSNLFSMQSKIQELQAELAAVPVFEPNPMVAKMGEVYMQARAKVAAELARLANARALHAAEAQKERAIAKTAHGAVLAKAKEAEAIIREGTRKRLEELQAEEEEARAACQNADEVVKYHRQTKALLTERLSQAKKLLVRSVGVESKAAEIQTKLNAEKDFLGVMKGFLGSIFDEALQEISDETNKVLAAVANTRHCTLQFRSEGVTQKGTIRKEIKPVVTIGGYEAPMKSGLSGGMLSAVELAVDLAVGAVVSRRSGACPGWLILDESFDGLDAVSKEACLEVLNKFTQDRLVLVADHMAETKGMFSQKIVVEYSEGESRIV